MENMQIMNNEPEEVETKEAELLQGKAIEASKTVPPAEKKGASAGGSDPQPSGDLKKTRLIIAIVTLIISLAFIIAGSVLLAEEGGGSSSSLYYDETISTGSNYVYISSNTKVFKFVPSSTGYYLFYTDKSSLDSYAVLKDASGNTLTYNDNGGNYSNFRILWYLYSGDSYYLEVQSFSGSMNANVYVYMN